MAVIAEVKKASPSAGPIALDCDASKQALHYQDGGAAAISVLTEPESFGGSFTDLSDVSDAVNVPVLCKDFVVDPVQLFVARGHGADAVLLMVSVLGGRIAEYIDIAETLGLQALVEVHDASELDIALAAKARIVGVNSRDLRTLEVDSRAASGDVRAAADAGVIVVAESGVRVRADVEAAAREGAQRRARRRGTDACGVSRRRAGGPHGSATTRIRCGLDRQGRRRLGERSSGSADKDGHEGATVERNDRHAN